MKKPVTDNIKNYSIKKSKDGTQQNKISFNIFRK